MSDKISNEELDQKLSGLKELRSRLVEKAEKLVIQRDKLDERFTTLRNEISALKDERDCSTETVRELKQQRYLLRGGAHGKIERLKRIRAENENLAVRKPERSESSLRAEFEKLEWRIQTESLSKEEEKPVLSHVKRLEIQLNVYRKTAEKRQKIDAIERELDVINAEERKVHAKVLSTAQKSQTLHEKMLSKIEESKTIKTQADTLHKSFIETMEKSNEIDKEVAQVQALIRQRIDAMHREDQIKRKHGEESIRTDLEKRAKEKLKQGGKLTWEEFQVLAEKGDMET